VASVARPGAVKLRGPEDVDEKLFADWLKQARAIELSR
jgi:hypothetical protein